MQKKSLSKPDFAIAPAIFAFVLLMSGLKIQAQDTTAPKGQVIDRVVAIVGKNVVLESDIENQYISYRMQENIRGSAREMRCKILENILFQKLMVAQAEVDSIKVEDAQVNGELGRRLSGFINQFGSQEKLEKYYGKTISEIKSELYNIVKDQMLAQQVQQNIIKDVTVTPSEISSYFRSLPADSVPRIKTEYVIREIVKNPPISVEEKLRVKEKLLDLRKRILNGESFSTMAILYSEDPGSAKKGGELGFYGRGQLYPQFEAVAFKLKPGEISDIVETKAGYHIIQMIARKGDYINVRHILMIPKVSPGDLLKARIQLDTIVKKIRSGKITFDKAVEKYSDDESKNDGGYLINPYSGGISFTGEQLDPQVSFTIEKMKVGEISNPVPMKTQEDQKDAYRLLYLESKTEPHLANMKDDYASISQWALHRKQKEVIDKWINEKAAHTYIKIIQEYKKCPFKHHWKTQE